MCSKQEQSGRHFMVNGSDCIVALDSTGISWSRSHKSKPTKRVDYSHIISVRRHHRAASKTSNDKQFTKLKIYYARSNENNSHGRYLKLKKLIIASKSSCATSPSSTDASDDSGLADLATSAATTTTTSQINGSNSHLSSLSSTSSTLTSTATRSVASSPSQQLEHKQLCDKLTQSTSISSSASSLDELAHDIELAFQLKREQRPKSLLIFVNPFGGKGRALYLYKTKVKRLLDLAQIQATLVVTEHANHARNTIEDPKFDVSHYDGIICVGGDGMFSELMNGLLFRYNRDIISGKQQQMSKDTITKTTTTSDNHDDDAKSLNIDNLRGDDNESRRAVDLTADNCEMVGRDSDANIATRLDKLRGSLGGIGRPFVSPPIPLGVIGAGSTDANSFGLIGTNDVITATLNIIIGNQISIDACSIHSIHNDKLLRFVSTFVAYGYFGDVVRESEKLRWLGPSRYDVTGLNNLLKNRSYQGLVSILVSSQDGSPHDLQERCHQDCQVCFANNSQKSPKRLSSKSQQMTFIERKGSFVGVNAAVMACRCPKTRKGFSPNNHLANGCADLILVRPCSRMQYIRYLVRTGWTKKSPFDLNYVEAYRCRQFEFLTPTSDPRNESRHIASDGSSCSASTSSASSEQGSSKGNSLDSKVDHSSSVDSNFSSWNADGEILDEQSIRVKVNNQLLRVFGTGEP